MFHRILPLALLCGSITFGTSAQPGRIVSPTLEGYLEVIPQVMAAATESDYYLRDVIHTEFSLRYRNPTSASFQSLNIAYRALDDTLYSFLNHRPVWNHWLILAWIAEQRIDLNQTAEFSFEDYQVKVTPRDFNADGVNEWLLDVRSYNFTQFVVITQVDGQYRLVQSALPFFAQGLTYYMTSSGFAEELLFEDINGDVLPEWIVAIGGFGANQTSGGGLYILNWQDGQLVDVGPTWPNRIEYAAPAGGGWTLFPVGVRVDFPDENADGSREVVIEQEQRDNWGCEWLLRRIFAWDGTAFSLSDTTRTESVVRGCEIRAAEERMWLGDYQAAITHYERALDLPTVDDDRYLSAEELNRYATARLALAYILTGQGERAEATLAALPEQPDESPVLTNFIAAVRGNVDDPSAACQAAYDVFASACVPGTDMCLGSPLIVIVGYTLENSGYGAGSPSLAFPAPEQAGCDLAFLAGGALTPIPTLTIQPTPVPEPPPDYRSNPERAVRDVLDAMEQGAFEVALPIMDQGLQAESIDDSTRFALKYMQAMAYEFAGQQNDALAQYAAIVQLSPDSAWGKLAALHIER